MSHLRFSITTTTCLSALLVSAAAQGDPARVREGGDAQAPGKRADATRFVDAASLRGAVIYSAFTATVKDYSDKGREERGGDTQTQQGASGRGELLGSVSDLLACPRSGGSSEGCAVKVVVNLAGTTASDGNTDHGQAGGEARTGAMGSLTVPLTDLKWNADGRYLTCNKSREALRAMVSQRGTDTTQGGTVKSGDVKTGEVKTGEKVHGGTAEQQSAQGERELKVADLTMAPVKSSDGVVGRLGTLVLDVPAGTLAYVLATGFDAKSTSDAATGREGATTEGDARREGATPLVTASGRDSIVIPFGIIRVDADKPHGGGADARTGTGYAASTPQLSVPMPAAAFAGAPQLTPTRLSQLADPTFEQKVKAFYQRAGDASGRSGN